MKLVRHGLFETNSSSTHALVVPHTVSNDNYSIYDSLDHNYSFGREECRLVEHYDEKLAYVYYVLKDFNERTNYHKTNPDDSWGCDYGITEEVLEQFRSKVNKAYKEVVDETKRQPYDSEPTPDDIFYLIDHPNIKPIDKDRYISWEKGRYVEFIFTPKESVDRDMTSEEYSITNKYDVDDDTVILIKELTDEEQRVVELSHVLPEYVSSCYHSVYVDHTEDFISNGFLDKIINADIDYIKKLIFSKESYITIGGDEYRGYNIKTIGFEFDYSDHDEYYENEAGERCPDRDLFPNTSEGWDQYWEMQKKYPIVRDNGGFNDKLREYEKTHDVFLKGN